MKSNDMQVFILGKTWEEATRTPTLEEQQRKMWKMINSAKPLFSLGIGKDGEMWITEEERENHMHILGTTGEGKTKMLERMMRHDIRRGNPFLYLDSSTSGNSAREVLKYCAHKKKKNVIYFDPAHLFSKKKVLGLNPFLSHPSLEDASVTNVVDTVKVIFNAKDESETPIISKVLPALLHVLYKAGMTLYEAIYFSERDNELYARKREAIFSKIPPYDRHLSFLRELYNPKNPAVYGESRSTLRRLEPMFNDIISLSLAFTGIDWDKVIRDGYTVIAYIGGYHLTPIQRRLLGTLLINGIDFAVDRLRSNGWKGVYYIYLDEAQEYATRKISDILARKRQNGLRLILAHHYMGQFEDKLVHDAILNLTKTKIAFHIPNPDERMKIVKMFYGGDLIDRDVSYVLGQQKKQYAVVKKGKEAATIIKIPTVREVDVDIDAYLDEIDNQPFYSSPKEIKEIIDVRLSIPNTQRPYPVSTGGTAESSHKTTTNSNKNKTKDASKKTNNNEGRREDNQRRKDTGVSGLFMAAKRRQQSSDGSNLSRRDGKKSVRKSEAGNNDQGNSDDMD